MWPGVRTDKNRPTEHQKKGEGGRSHTERSKSDLSWMKFFKQ